MKVVCASNLGDRVIMGPTVQEDEEGTLRVLQYQPSAEEWDFDLGTLESLNGTPSDSDDLAAGYLAASGHIATLQTDVVISLVGF